MRLVHLLQKKNRLIRNPVFAVLFLVFVLGSMGWYATALPSLSQEHFFAGVNLYSHPVSIRINASQRLFLNQFDTFFQDVSTLDELNVEVLNEAGEVLETKQIPVPSHSSLSLALLSEADETQQCIASANLSSYYYGDTPAEAQDIKVLSNQPVSVYAYKAAHPLALLVFPGRSNGVSLPGELRKGQSIVGILPVDCKHVEDAAVISELATVWYNWDPHTQRLKYQDYLELVSQTPEYKVD